MRFREKQQCYVDWHGPAYPRRRCRRDTSIRLSDHRDSTTCAITSPACCCSPAAISCRSSRETNGTCATFGYASNRMDATASCFASATTRVAIACTPHGSAGTLPIRSWMTRSRRCAGCRTSPTPAETALLRKASSRVPCYGARQRRWKLSMPSCCEVADPRAASVCARTFIHWKVAGDRCQQSRHMSGGSRIALRDP